MSPKGCKGSLMIRWADNNDPSTLKIKCTKCSEWQLIVVRVIINKTTPLIVHVSGSLGTKGD